MCDRGAGSQSHGMENVLELSRNPQADAVVRALYADHRASLLSYLRRFVPDREQAEDVLQETMLRAWRNAHTLDTRTSVWGWLSTVARNIAIDRIRASQARPAEVDEAAAADSTVDDHAEDVVTAVALRRALGRLSPAHRSVLREVYFRNRTCAEAAVTLGIPVGTVKSRLYWALRHLTADLGAPIAVYPEAC
jgi:RNA polymerase sigma-70 factor (ECF subfamily)